ncbi:MAG: anhydro-N-acetylmuramic acid kinase [Luteibaculaceae bacterium]
MILRKVSTVGVMSGTSLDGLDVALCDFYLDENNNVSKYEIIAADTFELPWFIIPKFQNPDMLSGIDIFKLHNQFGKFTGEKVKELLNQNPDYKPEFIASHGHTVYHKPEENFTVQIGSSAEISAVTFLPVVSNFRALDVALGGNGAPLVPYGDKVLFNNYHACINLGGFSNISILNQDKLKAFDIAPCNILLNYLAAQVFQKYDDQGKLAAKGSPNYSIIQSVKSKLSRVKEKESLGREWFNSDILPFFSSSNSIEDKLATATHFIAEEISETIKKYNIEHVLITGGGAFNNTLVNLIQEKSKAIIIIPESKIVQYKEALIFALLGLMRISKSYNVLAEYTGAKRNSSSGDITYV